MDRFLVFTVLYGIAAVVCAIVILARVCIDWVFMPLSWKYAVGATTSAYWKNMVTIKEVGRDLMRGDGEKVVYASLPFRQYAVAAGALLALLLWGLGGYGTVHRMISGDTLTMTGVLWIFLTAVIGGCLFLLCSLRLFKLAFTPKGKLSPKYKDGLAMFLGKFCKTLVYPSTPKTD